MPSSSLTTIGSPRRCGTSTGTTSSSKTPFFQAAAARWCERAAKASCSSRVRCSTSSLRVSVRAPIAWSVKTSQRPSNAMWSRTVDVAVLVALARLGHQVRRVGHRLHAAGDDDVALTGTNQLVGERDGVDARQADLVDGDRRYVHRDAALDCRLASRALTGPGLEHLAHDHVVDSRRIDTRLGERGFDGDTAQIGGGLVLQAPEQAPDRGAGPGHDDTRGSDAFSHDPPSSTAQSRGTLVGRQAPPIHPTQRRPSDVSTRRRHAAVENLTPTALVNG